MIEFEGLSRYFLITGLVLFANVIVLRNVFFQLADPIWFFVIINTAVTVGLVIFLSTVAQPDWQKISYVVACQTAFLIAARSTASVLRIRCRKACRGFSANEYHLVERMLRVCVFLLAILLGYYIWTGIPLFSADPELARVTNRADGGGGIARLANGVAYLSLALSFLIKPTGHRSLKWIGILLPVALLVLTSSKASLLFVYIAYFHAKWFTAMQRGERMENLFPHFFFTALLILAISFLSLYLRAGEIGTVGTDVEFALDQLISRIALAGMGAGYYFSQEAYSLFNKAPLDYFYDFIVLPMLAPFRLVPYEATLGHELAYFMTGSSVFGPNPSMYVEGHVYFGWGLGPFYCLVLGIIFSVVRYGALLLTRLGVVNVYLLFLGGNMLITFMTYDMILFTAELLNFAAALVLCRFLVSFSYFGTTKVKRESHSL